MSQLARQAQGLSMGSASRTIETRASENQREPRTSQDPRTFFPDGSRHLQRRTQDPRDYQKDTDVKRINESTDMYSTFIGSGPRFSLEHPSSLPNPRNPMERQLREALNELSRESTSKNVQRLNLVVYHFETMAKQATEEVDSIRETMAFVGEASAQLAKQPDNKKAIEEVRKVKQFPGGLQGNYEVTVLKDKALRWYMAQYGLLQRTLDKDPKDLTDPKDKRWKLQKYPKAYDNFVNELKNGGVLHHLFKELEILPRIYEVKHPYRSYRDKWIELGLRDGY